MKILVTGAGGMLGSELVRTAQEYGIETIGLTHQELDICDQDSINTALARYNPEIIVNCAGIVKGQEETNPKLYYQVNTEGAKLLASVCDYNNIKMVQISTDCVFKGEKPCYEYEEPDATDTYGQSKAWGEVLNKNSLVLRMSFIGIGEKGLVSWVMDHAPQTPIDGYVNVRWNGMTVNYAAKNIIIAMLRGLTGIVHICGRDVSKYDVVCNLNNVLDLKLRIMPVSHPIIDRRLRTIYDYKFETPALRKQIKEMVDAYHCNSCRA